MGMEDLDLVVVLEVDVGATSRREGRVMRGDKRIIKQCFSVGTSRKEKCHTVFKHSEVFQYLNLDLRF